MSSDMKCVKCNSDLERIGDFYTCTNPHCTLCGDKDMWQELIRTRGALGIALDWLREVATPEKCDDDLCREFTKRKLIEIKKALEEKD